MQEIKVAAELRGEKSTKHELVELRKAKKIPAVVYGGKDKPVNVAVQMKELLEALKKAGANAIIHLKHSKGEDTVILKELQRDVVDGQPLHADFKRIDMKVKIVVQVPIHTVGEAPGVKLQGGLLEHVLRSIEVRALPGLIPQRLDLDVSKLNVTDSLHVRDLPIPKDIEVLNAPDQVICHVVMVKVEEAAPAPGAEAAAGTAEPELIAKGKKEEGEEGAEAGDKKAAGADKKGAAPAAGDKKAAAPAAKEGGKKEK